MENDELIINSAADFLTKIRNEDEVTVHFTKQDGKLRTMRCTLDFRKIPKKYKPKNVDVPKILKLITDKRILHVFDLDVMGWRVVPFDRTDWMDTKTKRYRIKREKEK